MIYQSKNEARDSKIVFLAKSGIQFKTLAKMFSLSKGRIKTICHFGGVSGPHMERVKKFGGQPKLL